MSTLRNNEKQILEKLLGMETGYVLDFTNRSFRDFVKTAVDIDIYADKYDRRSGSKANRLRAFWDKESDETVGKLILELLERVELKSAFDDGFEVKEEQREMLEQVRNVAKNMISDNSTSQQENSIKDVEITESILDDLNLSPEENKIIAHRIQEIKKCSEADIKLATLFLAGSTLEGILLTIAKRDGDSFSSANAAPVYQETGDIIPVDEWKLNDLINVAYELDILEEDVKQHAHSLRHFRNYIHPQQQKREGFSPSKNTSEITWKVLKAAINQIAQNTSS